MNRGSRNGWEQRAHGTSAKAGDRTEGLGSGASNGLPKIGKRPGDGPCRACGKTSHWSREYPTRQPRHDGGAMGSRAATMVAITREDPGWSDAEGIGDTAAESLDNMEGSALQASVVAAFKVEQGASSGGKDMQAFDVRHKRTCLDRETGRVRRKLVLTDAWRQHVAVTGISLYDC